MIFEDSPKWREMHIYSLAGITSVNEDAIPFCNPQSDEKHLMAFGGFFRYDPISKLIIEGQLADTIGQSAMAGRMSKEELEFTKIYQNGNVQTTYKFQQKNGVWIGTSDLGGLLETARCVTSLVSNDAFEVISCGHPLFFMEQRQMLAKKYGFEI
jgi:hypothetical protein